ncbi:MAG: hypothetical protein LJE85_00110 [Gammaproteobacteria bacterium]|nr:hypothetical protein [Gammaproteobacteria bacterium]
MNNKIYVYLFIVILTQVSVISGQCWAQGAQSGALQGSVPAVGTSVNTTAGTSAASPANKSASESLSAFRSLDQETELLVKEVMDLSSDLAIIQEEEDNPANHQLLVLVTFDPTKLFALDYIQLEVDNEIVAAYQYSENDLQALKRGAGHRLYVANMPAGMHELFATMVGRIPRDPDYKSEVAYKFVSGVSRTVLELNVSSKAKGFPILAIKEWN